MSKRENVIIMLNKLKTAKTTRNLQEEFEEVYKDLTATREEIGQAVDKRTEEMQEEMDKQTTYRLIIEETEAPADFVKFNHKIIIKDLSNNNPEDRQAIIKTLM